MKAESWKMKSEKPLRSPKFMIGQKSAIPVERIERSILLIRGHKVMLDADLGSFMALKRKH
jgi:hypothetical protein